MRRIHWAGGQLILDGSLFRVVDDEDVNHAFLGFQFEAELLLHGLEPVFFPGGEDEHVHDEHCGHDHAPAAASAKEVGRNDPCPCGSGKKYKKCCGAA